MEQKGVKFDILTEQDVIAKIGHSNENQEYKRKLADLEASDCPLKAEPKFYESHNYERQQQLKFDLNEAKRHDKYLQRERKTREKWFDHIVSREQHMCKQYGHYAVADACGTENTTASQLSQPFDSIDDMQEKHMKKMPDFRQLHGDPETSMNEDDSQSQMSHIKLDWISDSLQTIEFLVTFGDKLQESLETGEAEPFQFGTILTNIELFHRGLENKSEKLKREISQIVQLLLRCLLSNIAAHSSSLNDDGEEDDDFYLVNKLNELDCTDLTYSELLRLYVKRSLLLLRQRRQFTVNKFNTDVTAELCGRLEVFTTSLGNQTFDQLSPGLKASLMAFLCDELLSTSSSMDFENRTTSADQGIQEEDGVSCVVNDLDATIDELNALKHEKWQLESKTRQLKTEKYAAEKQHVEPTESNKHHKLVVQLDKKLAQFDKKRIEIKQDHDRCANKLRSGMHLGQDRYLRHYWSLASSGGIFIEATSKCGPGSLYLSEDSTQLLPNEALDPAQSAAETDEDMAVKNYSHFIERLSIEDPFKFILKSNLPEVLQLTFRDIEHLIKNQIQFKQPQNIDAKYLNASPLCSSKWWICDNEVLLKQLIDCLGKRGYRERALAKCLMKFNEENCLHESLTTSDQPKGINQVFEKVQNFFKDFDCSTASTASSSQLSAQEYREQLKLLKYVYALEDRVFTANLQQCADTPAEKLDLKRLEKQKCSNDSETPFEIARGRLVDLERRIERRYLKFPFVTKKTIVVPASKIIDDDSDSANEEKNEDGEPVCSPTLTSLSATKKANANAKNSPKSTKSSVIVTKELERWRRLVTQCNTSHQLAVLVGELNKVIAWDKSIMKVICQICNSDDNEDKLLLCDNCDCGNHTYCFKPPLEE